MTKFSQTTFELVKNLPLLQPALLFGPNLHTNLTKQNLSLIHENLELPQKLTTKTGSSIFNGTKFWNINTEKFSRNLPKSGITGTKAVISFLKSCQHSNEIDDEKVDRDYVCIIGLKDDMVPLAASLARAFPKFSAKTGKNLDKDRNIKINFVSIDDDNKCEKNILIDLIDNIREAARIFDTPCNVMNAEMFEKEAINAVKNLKNVKVQVFQSDYLKENGFGGLYSVGQGSPPGHNSRLIILSLKNGENKKNVALVGKGIVYDTGGLSIKSKSGMPGMKGDCGGAAGLLFAFKQAVQSNFNQNLFCLLCVAENSVGPLATRPDDILNMYSGLTVEVNNTDAEGRLVLADGVAYASKDLKADIILDMCTLTGAQSVTTGEVHASVMTNVENYENLLVKAGLKCGDCCYPIIYAPEILMKEFKSPVADMKNSVQGRSNAQCSCAGNFIGAHLKNGFDFDGVWIHVDMAGPGEHNMYLDGLRGTGYGVSLVNCLFSEYLEGNEIF